jgi:hypothetical protein
MPVTAEQIRIASTINDKARELFAADLTVLEILAAMHDYMPDFKRLIDSQPGDDGLAELGERFPSFNRYAKILENVAEAIQTGRLARQKTQGSA